MKKVPKNVQKNSILLCRKILKEQILKKTFTEHLSAEFSQLLNVLSRTVDYGESDSVLVIGPHGCGKTTLVNETLKQLSHSCKNKEYTVINLNGFIHIDDNLALKDIIRQLNFESIDCDKFGGSFSDNLQYLLQSFRDGEGRTSKALIFVLEEFHLFCSHRNQTLLYNLFDSAQSSQSVCVVGITSRIDVTEMLEKRVKSRFSHRQLLLLYHPTIEQRISIFVKLLQLPLDSCSKNFDSNFSYSWNKHIEEISNNNSVIRTLKRQMELDTSENKFRSFLVFLVSLLSDEHCLLKANDVMYVYKKLYQDDKVALLEGLSVLEMCLIIAMSHQTEIFDSEPFNFEMIAGRYLKFANQNSAVQITQRPVILKAFERIKNLELIYPVSYAGKNIQKEFQLYNFLLTKEQVTSAVNSYTGIPTDVSQWASSCLM